MRGDNAIRQAVEKFLQRLYGAGMRPRQDKDEAATAMDIRKLFGRCPVCQGDFTNHEYAPFAMTIATDDRQETLQEFFAALKKHRWTEARAFQAFDSMLDGAEAIALQCSQGRIAMLLLRSPAEFYENPSLLDYEIVETGDSQPIRSQIEPSQWQSFAEKDTKSLR